RNLEFGRDDGRVEAQCVQVLEKHYSHASLEPFPAPYIDRQVDLVVFEYSGAIVGVETGVADTTFRDLHVQFQDIPSGGNGLGVSQASECGIIADRLPVARFDTVYRGQLLLG